LRAAVAIEKGEEMKKLRLSALLLSACLLLLLHTNVVAAQEVKLDNVPFQQILDRLFGTTGNPGLIDGNKRFEVHAEDVILTGDQARTFFVPTTANTSDIADLIAATQRVRGDLKVEGRLDGSPFEFKLSGRQIKLEGLDLTRAQLDSLVDQLKGISGLREAKIESRMDGRPLEVKIENRADRVKIEDGERRDAVRVRERERPDLHDGRSMKSRDGEASNRGQDSVERRDKMERPDKMDKVERDRVEKVDGVVRPDVVRPDRKP